MKRICIFGDSITWGMGISERVGWADLLRNYLEQQSDYYIEVYSLGIDRDTSKDLLKRIEAESAARMPDLIIIDIGANDSLQYMSVEGLAEETPEGDFRDNLQSIVEIAKKFTNEIIFLGLTLGDESLTNPLPRSTTGKRYTKERISKYNDIVEDVASRNNLAFINTFDILNDSDFIDGLHPNGMGHSKIFNRLIELRGSYFNERNVIVDENDNVIGAKVRSEITSDDIYRVSGLWIENNSNQVLLAKRSKSKSQNPDRWMPVVASGTVAENESYEDNIVKEAMEELGIDLSKKGFELIQKKLINTKYNFYAAVFKSKSPISKEEIRVDSNETSELRWFDKGDLKRAIEQNPDEFVPEMSQVVVGLL